MQRRGGLLQGAAAVLAGAGCPLAALYAGGEGSRTVPGSHRWISQSARPCILRPCQLAKHCTAAQPIALLNKPAITGRATGLLTHEPVLNPSWRCKS